MRKVSPNPSKRSTRRAPSAPTLADFVARAQKNVPITVSFPHALSWWRTLRADQFNRTHVVRARRVLIKSAIIGEPHWFLAAAGDAAVAIGVALRAQKRASDHHLSLDLDLAMTAVLNLAIQGNEVARLLMASALRRQSRLDPLCGALSDSWLISRRR